MSGTTQSTTGRGSGGQEVSPGKKPTNNGQVPANNGNKRTRKVKKPRTSTGANGGYWGRGT
jgi:hypothetical protein